MQLFLLRHGEADWPNWTKPDDERPLTDKGNKEMAEVAAFLAALDISPEVILTSPLPRAAQTAEVVAKKLKIKLREDSMLEPGFDASDLHDLLGQYPAESVMIVGHEPDFSEVIGDLTGGSVKLSKAGLALVELDGKRGKLRWLFPPKVAKAAAPAR